MDSDLVLVIVVVDGARVRLHQRLPRHRQRRRHVDLDPRDDARGVAVALASILNFVGAFLSLAGRGDDRHGHRRRRPRSRRRSSSPASIGAIAWNLVTWYFGLPSSLVARADRRRRRRDARRRGPERRRSAPGLLEKVVDPGAHRPGARLRRRGVAILVAYRIVGRQRPGAGQPRLPPRPDRHRQRCSRSRTAPTTRRRRWASSSWRSSRNGNLDADRRRPALGGRLLGDGDRRRHLRRRLAHHPHHGQPDHQDGPGAGLRRAGRRRGGDPLGLALRLPALDDARHARARSWARARPSALSAVRWGVAGNIVVAWVLTLPAAAAVGALDLRRRGRLRRRARSARWSSRSPPSGSCWPRSAAARARPDPHGGGG